MPRYCLIHLKNNSDGCQGVRASTRPSLLEVFSITSCLVRQFPTSGMGLKGSTLTADTENLAKMAGESFFKKEDSPPGAVQMREPEEFEAAGKEGALSLSAALDAMSVPAPAITALNQVLGASPIDLKQVAAVARAYAAPTAQVLKLCNSSIFSLPRPVVTLVQATISLGAGVLQALGLTWGLVERARMYLPPAVAQPFWQHSLTVALLSERIAERMDYPVTEAYLAGFLHDIGRIPLWIAAVRQNPESATTLGSAAECTATETRRFGADHCELGRRIGTAWQFCDSFLEVFSLHHQPPTGDETELVRIVTTAEEFCSRRAATLENKASCRPEVGQRDQEAPGRPPGLEAPEGMSLAEALEFEFLQAAQSTNLASPRHRPPAWAK